MILLLHAFEIAAAHSSPAAVNKLLSRSPSVMQEPFCASHCLSSRGLHSPWKASWGDIPWLCVLDEKVVYGSQGIYGTFHGAALLGSFKSMYLVWSHFLKYHSQFLVFLFFFFRWCSPMFVLGGTTQMYLNLDGLCFFFETSLPTSYPTTFLAWCQDAIPGKTREKEQAPKGGGCC